LESFGLSFFLGDVTKSVGFFSGQLHQAFSLKPQEGAMRFYLKEMSKNPHLWGPWLVF